MKKLIKKGKFIPLNDSVHEDSGLINVRYILDRDTHRDWVDIDMIIWDCDRKVKLDFSFEDEDGRDERLGKINCFREALDLLEEYVLDHEFRELKEINHGN